MLKGLGQIVGPIFRKDADKELSLRPVFTRLDLVRTALPPASHDQLVYRETLGARELHQDTGAIDSKRVDRFRDQEIEIV